MTKTEAIDLFGGRARDLADALGITEQAISQWGEEVPPMRVFQIRVVLEERRNANPDTV